MKIISEGWGYATILAVFLLMISVWGVPYFKIHIKSADAIDAIVGEAANQDLFTKTCVACAIKNRGTLNGVYGFNAKHNSKESAKTWADATRAWQLALSGPDLVHGAKNFRSFADPKPHVVLDDGDVLTMTRCGAFYFYSIKRYKRR